MTSPFHCVAEAYRAQGYSVIPLVARSKRVIIKEWSRYCTELADDDTFAHWMAWPESNIGLCLGSASGVFALDYDIDRNGLHKQIQAIVPASPCVKRGAKGFTAFYRYDGQRSAGYKSDGVTVIDILAGGKQTVIPPSRHPDGMDYEWDGLSLLQVSRDDLPVITASQMAEVGRLFKTHEPRYTPPVDFNFDSDADIDTALQYVRADDYDTWVRMGMALKDHLGEAGFGLWDAWSSRGNKYGGSGETRKKWQSFKSQGISVATVFYEAMQAGFKPRPMTREEVKSVIEAGGNMTTEKKSTSFLDNIPGLPGLIAEHINASAGYKQPLLALATALATAGTIMGNRVISRENNVKTNIFAIGIGESASGKDHAMTCAQTILKECGLINLVMGEPASGSGLMDSLHKNGEVALSLIDEFGYFFAGITGKNTPKHLLEIKSAWLQLYNGGRVMGKDFANKDGKNPRKDIENSCYSMSTITTPDKFYGALTSDDALDGLMSRFLVFETHDFPIKWRQERKADDLPSSLRAAIETWAKAGVGGNMPGAYNPVYIPMDPEASDFITEITEKYRTKSMELTKAGAHWGAVYARLGHNARKIAVIAHEGQSITMPVMQWALQVAEYCADVIIEALKNKVSDNEQEKMLKRIKDICKRKANKENIVSHRDVVQATSSMKPRDRADIIRDLITLGFFEACEGEKPKRGPTPIFYKIII